MIANIEVNGFTIKIENIEGIVEIRVERDGETVDEMTLDEKEFNGEESEVEGGDDKDANVKSFDQFNDEENEEEVGEESEEDEAGEENEEDEAGEEDEKDEDESSNESIKSFKSFFKGKK